MQQISIRLKLTSKLGGSGEPLKLGQLAQHGNIDTLSGTLALLGSMQAAFEHDTVRAPCGATRGRCCRWPG